MLLLLLDVADVAVCNMYAIEEEPDRKNNQISYSSP